MKPWFRILIAVLTWALAASATQAQTQPVVSVSITAPLNESAGASGSPVTVTAQAVGVPPFSYQFFANGLPIGLTASLPGAGSTTWTPPQPGTYFFTAIATDLMGNTATSLPVRFFATGTAIISPVANTLVPNGSSVVIQATATPPPAGTSAFVQRVDFYADGLPIGTDSTYPYSIIYSPPAAPAAHTIEARAFNNNGAQISPDFTATRTINMVTPIGIPPRATISTPANSASIAIGGDVTVAIDAFSQNGLITKVELYIDGVLFSTDSAFPYTFTWRPTVVGIYKLVALAYDDKNNVVATTTSTPGMITPEPTIITIAAPPTVTIIAPTTGSTVTGGTGTQLVANATDSGGNTIRSVMFYVDGTYVGEGRNLNTSTPSVYSTSATLTQKTDPDTGAPLPSIVTAIATNSINLSGVSPGVSVSVTTGGGSVGGPTTVVGIPPTVSVTSPTAGTQMRVSSPVVVTATASDTDGNISSVQFFVGTQSIATDSVYPYSATWTPNSLGTYAIMAAAIDNDGNSVTSTAVTVSVVDPSPTAPAITIAAPVAGETIPVNAPFTLRANASDIGSIVGVQFFVNGQPEAGPVTAFPYTLSWTPKSPGSYTISARATNATGNQTTSAPLVVNVSGGTPPTISLSNPGSTVILGTPVDLSASVTPGTGATIQNVQFYANGLALGALDTSFPYGVSWAPGAPGSYVLTAVATDSFGNQTTSTAANVTVVTGSSTAPFVMLTSSPTNTNVTVNTPVFISAVAGDPDGVVSSVSFYVNNQLVGSKATEPYATFWVPTSAGTFNVTAVATDDAGNRTTSAAATLTTVAAAGNVPVAALTFNNPKVDTPAPGAAATTEDPLKPVLVSYGSKLILAAPAVDQDGTIARVQFFVNGTSIATVTAEPFFTVYTLNTLSDVVLTAIATDSSGNSVYTNPIFIDTVPSTSAALSVVTLISPPDGARYVVGRQITWSATHNFGNVEPPKIDFYVDGMQFTTVTAPAGAATSEPAQTVLGLTRAGNYTIHAVARAGNTTTISAPARISVVGNIAPVVTIGAPSAGASFVVGNTISVAANASDTDGTLRSVQFFVNGQALSNDTIAPYTATWSPGATGNYILTALATDDTGSQSMSAPVSVSITSNVAPAVALTSPIAGTTVSSGTVLTLAATASDVDGRVATVRFFANGNLVGTASAAPFTVEWRPSAAGAYTITAQATDDSGNVANSTSLMVTVSENRAPTVTVTAPASGATFRVGVGTALTATAADNDGTITSVQFFANGTAVGAPDTSPPYNVQWSPNSEGIYRITATAVDNAGGSTTSSVVTVFAFTEGAGDTVYSGTYAGQDETGRFAAINVRGRTAAVIAYSSTTPSRTYFFPGLTVDSAGGFSSVEAGGRVAISGAASDTGMVGTMDGGRLTFIGPIIFATGTSSVPAGYYNGNLTARPSSLLAAIVGPDGSIHVFVTDGAGFRDAGSGIVNSSGAFAVTTSSGTRVTGTISPATGFLTGTLTGGPGGAITAALSSGASFSDGFLRNLSTRGQVGSGANVLIAGFVVAGETPKQVLIRAIGPALAAFGVDGVLIDPQLQLFQGSLQIASNDQWTNDFATTSAMARAGAFPLTAGSLDSVIVMNLAPGAYTAQVSGVGGRTGVALIELYDLDNAAPFSAQKVTNVATRGVVGTGQAQLIAGFTISGNTAKKLLIRGVGPSLANVGVTSGFLADPILRLVRGDNTVVRDNDNWESGNDGALVADAAMRVNAFALARGGRDAAILVSLPPGTYTVQVTGAGTSTGIALVEVYEVP